MGLESSGFGDTYLDPRSPRGPTAWKGLVSVSLKIPPPAAMFGWLCCGLWGAKRKPAEGNLKLGTEPKRKDDCVGSNRKLSEGVGIGPIELIETGDGW